jgi:hypothetical protein
MKKGIEIEDRLSSVRKEYRRMARGNVARTILEIIGTAGFVSTTLLAPNVLGALYKIGENKQKRWYVWNKIKELEQKGLLTRSINNSRYQLTKKGRDMVAGYEIGKIKIRKPLRWDGRWRLVIFDIREHMRAARDELRDMLNVLGFRKLQNSVWVHPYPCADVISLIKRKHNLGNAVLYLEVDVLENDRDSRDFFNLN